MSAYVTGHVQFRSMSPSRYKHLFPDTRCAMVVQSEVVEQKNGELDSVIIMPGQDGIEKALLHRQG